MIDFITKLPWVIAKSVILVMCDRLSKIAYFVTLIEEILVKELARIMCESCMSCQRVWFPIEDYSLQ